MDSWKRMYGGKRKRRRDKMKEALPDRSFAMTVEPEIPRIDDDLAASPSRTDKEAKGPRKVVKDHDTTNKREETPTDEQLQPQQETDVEGVVPFNSDSRWDSEISISNQPGAFPIDGIDVEEESTVSYQQQQQSHLTGDTTTLGSNMHTFATNDNEDEEIVTAFAVEEEEIGEAEIIKSNNCRDCSLFLLAGVSLVAAIVMGVMLAMPSSAKSSTEAGSNKNMISLGPTIAATPTAFPSSSPLENKSLPTNQDFAPCSVCGEGLETDTARADTMVNIPSTGLISCSDIEQNGLQGLIDPNVCPFLPTFVKTPCNCQVTGTVTQPVLPPPFPSPVLSPTPVPSASALTLSPFGRTSPAGTPIFVLPITQAPTPVTPVPVSLSPVAATPAGTFAPVAQPVSSPVAPTIFLPSAVPLTPAPVTPVPVSLSPVTATPAGTFAPVTQPVSSPRPVAPGPIPGSTAMPSLRPSSAPSVVPVTTTQPSTAPFTSGPKPISTLQPVGVENGGGLDSNVGLLIGMVVTAVCALGLFGFLVITRFRRSNKATSSRTPKGKSAPTIIKKG